MKRIILLFVLFIGAQIFAQTNGISYQAIILNPEGEHIPGVNNPNSPVVNKDICMIFKILDETSNVEYQEVVQTKTDGFGMVNLVIGHGSQTGGYASSFQGIEWESTRKSLVVGINTNGSCNSFIEISNQELGYTPFAYAAVNAEHVSGVVAIENGGTNATTLVDAKKNLGIDNVDNTTDLNKPISTATQTALNLKEDVTNKSLDIISDGTSDTKYPSTKATKDYVDANVSVVSNDLATEVSRATIMDNALTNTLNKEISDRTTEGLLKEDVLNKSTNIATDANSDTKYPSVKSVKSYVDASVSAVSNDLTAVAVNATIMNNALTNTLNKEISDRASEDLLKENVSNKSTNIATDAASDTKYPSVKAVKAYVDANSSSVAGADKQITFNKAGVSAGSANNTWDDGTNTHTVNGTSVTTNEQVTSLAGSGSRFVYADASGNLTTTGGGAGTANYLTKWATGGGSISNSLIQDNGASVGINADVQTNSQLYVYRQQKKSNGDGQATIYGYRTRDMQNNGTDYGRSGSNTGVTGLSDWGDEYSFGVGGWNYNDFTRTGGVIGGFIYGNYWGALGYKSSSTVTYGVYGSNAYDSGSGYLENKEMTGIGGGFFGVVGSATKGSVVGQLNAGELFSTYNSGNVYTLGKNVELVETANKVKTPVYSVTSTESTIYAKGNAQLVNGSAYIAFKEEYKALLGENPEVTVTPKGNCNGVYIADIDKNGFTIKELNNGTSTVAVSWISVGNRLDNKMDKATEMVTDANFERNVQKVLFNDSNLDGKGSAIWWDGNKIQFGTLPESLAKVKRPNSDSPKMDTPAEVKKEAIKRISDFSKAILFETGKATITADSYVVLNQICDVLKQYSSDNFTIEGNTDNTGESFDNVKLSKDRSEAVLNYLVKNGVNRDRLKAFGNGDKKPVASNDTEEGRKNNRRVEINLVK